ncbi:iron-sulfur cluster insertion protein ErpA [Desulfosporosinus acididurans]|uniref:Iron-sulfur cluster insertion protein ErpA n=2 Tax=Desulfosporosinus TaxID=79206 RepID=A0A0J1FY51_9FIRM|nr:iron-sulfur cluster insertion protein ErpA [Desulfosporosinus acididurans]
MTLDESKTTDDILDEGYGVSILTDKKLSSYLEGATIDFIDSKQGGGFEIRTANPSSDGCGSCGGGCS